MLLMTLVLGEETIDIVSNTLKLKLEESIRQILVGPES